MELLVGCGSRREKLIFEQGKKEWKDLITLDLNTDHKPDVIWNLNHTPYPFDDDYFDEIHAYEVLEHIGFQGGYRQFFNEFSEYWRILKPGGKIFATTPSAKSPWLWGDPSHTRVILPQTLVFLNQPSYTEQIGKTAMSDFRNIYKEDFDIHYSKDDDEFHWFVLKAIKPSRCSLVK